VILIASGVLHEVASSATRATQWSGEQRSFQRFDGKPIRPDLLCERGAKQLNGVGDALHWLRFMNQRTKHRVSTRPPKTAESKARGLGWFVAIPIAGLMLLTVALNLPRRNPMNPLRVETASNAPVALNTKGTDVSPSPTITVRTNEEESDNVDKAADLANRGTQLLAQGKIEEAVAVYQAAARLSPEDEDMHYNLALALARQGKREAARAEYLEALRIYPDYTEAHNNLGNLLVVDGKFDEAIVHFKDALKIASDNASAHSNLGKALALQGKFTDAIPCFREALRLKPDFLEARYNLARAYLAQKRTEEAISEFTAILQRRPDFAPAQKGLMEARQLQGK
jgi:tetratricopeptide (TPR) repeat protein